MGICAWFVSRWAFYYSSDINLLHGDRDVHALTHSVSVPKLLANMRSNICVASLPHPFTMSSLAGRVLFALHATRHRPHQSPCSPMERWFHHSIFDFHVLPLILELSSPRFPNDLHWVRPPATLIRGYGLKFRGSRGWCAVLSDLRISIYDQSMQSLCSISSRPLPWDIAPHPTENWLAVAHRQGNRGVIRICKTNGVLLDRWETVSNLLKVAVDEQGIIYVLTPQHTVECYQSNGHFTTLLSLRDVAYVVRKMVVFDQRLFVSMMIGVQVYDIRTGGMSTWRVSSGQRYYPAMAIDTGRRRILVAVEDCLHVLDFRAREISVCKLNSGPVADLEYMAASVGGRARLFVTDARLYESDGHGICYAEYDDE